MLLIIHFDLSTIQLSKQYLLPGWRVGWLIFHDKYVLPLQLKTSRFHGLQHSHSLLEISFFGSLQRIAQGVKKLAQNLSGASHLAQIIVPVLLDKTSVPIQAWKCTVREMLGEQARFVCQQLSTCDGLMPPEPVGGGMFLLVRFDPSRYDDMILSDVDFAKHLLDEENVLVLPGKCFGAQKCFRIVFCASIDTLSVAFDRIRKFCARHYQPAW
jgi:tyrosine aminotransferase